VTIRRVVIIGGGPGGYAAALEAARRGAIVTLVEAERPGGQCVHHTCIPTASLLSGAGAFLEAHEPALAGVFDLGEELRWGRLVARKDRLAAMLASGIGVALDRAGVEVVAGRAVLTSPSEVELTIRDGSVQTRDADAVVVAVGARWEAPSVDGVAPERVVTADVIATLDKPPGAAVVLGGGPGATAFGVEYAFLLAATGSTTALACPEPVVVPALDADLDPLVRAAIESVGVACCDWSEMPTDDDRLVVAADTRVPRIDDLGLAAAGVAASDHVVVDRAQRTSARSVFAAGDVTGGAMTSAAAEHAGRVAGANAAGGAVSASVSALPHVLHTLPEIGWVGATEPVARAAGHAVATGVADLTWSARSITLGGREGACKVIADATTGALLGVHVVGAGAAEILAVAAFAMQAECTLDQVAATVQWHPAFAEALSAAAREALR